MRVYFACDVPMPQVASLAHTPTDSRGSSGQGAEGCVRQAEGGSGGGDAAGPEPGTTAWDAVPVTHWQCCTLARSAHVHTLRPPANIQEKAVCF